MEEQVINENNDNYESNSCPMYSNENEESYPRSDDESEDDIPQMSSEFLYFIQAVKDDNAEFVLKAENSKQFIHIKDNQDILPIQYAVLFGNVKMIETLISIGANSEVNLEGVPLIHLSLAFSMYSNSREKSIQCFKFLNEFLKNIEYDKIDRLGRTIFHYIIMNDIYECLEFINVDYKKYLDIEDFNGDNCYSYFYIYNSKNSFNHYLKLAKEEFIKEILPKNTQFIENCLIYNSLEIFLLILEEFTENEENFLIILNELQSLVNRISDDCKISFVIKNILNAKDDDDNFNDITINKESVSENLRKYIQTSSFDNSKKKTLIIYHPTCELHGNNSAQKENEINKAFNNDQEVENPDRIRVLLQPPFGVFLSDFFIKNSEYINDSKPAVLSEISRIHDMEYIQSIESICNRMKNHNFNKLERYDADTYITKMTYESSLQAVGCVLEAVDQVMKNENANAFVAVRPPGHHAGYFGRVEPDNSQCHSSNGFCFFNNVIIGAAYCKNRYREKIKKIAIVDFDVHHGNGSEELIRCLVGEKFEYSNKTKFGEFNFKKNVKTCWYDSDDAENVLFISLHGYNELNPGLFYPSSGDSRKNTMKESDLFPGGVLNVPIFAESKLSHGYRNAFRTRVTNRLQKFKPDIIFVSAGFDGHEHEEINGNYMKLNEFDYQFITEELMRIANKFSNGRLISVLEGGYNIKSGAVSSFAQSVMTHVKFMNICQKKNDEYVKRTKIKRRREFENDLKNFNRKKMHLDRNNEKECYSLRKQKEITEEGKENNGNFEKNQDSTFEKVVELNPNHEIIEEVFKEIEIKNLIDDEQKAKEKIHEIFLKNETI